MFNGNVSKKLIEKRLFIEKMFLKNCIYDLYDIYWDVLY